MDKDKRSNMSHGVVWNSQAVKHSFCYYLLCTANVCFFGLSLEDQEKLEVEVMMEVKEGGGGGDKEEEKKRKKLQERNMRRRRRTR